ncbi:hypothetical protein [Nocardia sp. AB354]|uniref:hypothetical protein n=1 Tax=Nocardia sp. AB354 TaxID=3413283 RepID=UPI003C26244E
MSALIYQTFVNLSGLDNAAWPARTMAVLAPTDRPPTTRIGTGIDSSAGLPFFAGFGWLSCDDARAVADLAAASTTTSPGRAEPRP